MTTPSAPSSIEACTAARIRSQSAGVSCELSSASRSTTSTSRPAVRSAPLWVGRRTPPAPLLVEIVPQVAITVRRGIDASLRTPVAGSGEAASALRDDGTVSEEPTGRADEVAEPAAARPPRRLRLLLSVAAVVLTLDIVTKVLAVKLLPPGQPVSIIGDTVTWTLVRNSGAAFSMATGYTWVLTLIATIVVGGIFWMGRRLVSPWWAVGLGMILGGAMGNLVDRFFRAPGPLRGHVVDFLSVGWCRCSTWPTPRWLAGPSSWWCCRSSAMTSTPWVDAKPASADDRPLDGRPRGTGGHACRRRAGAPAGAVAQRRGGTGRRRRRRTGWCPGGQVRPPDRRCLAAGALARRAGAPGEHAGRHRRHDDPVFRRRLRRGRQAGGGGRARVAGLDRADGAWRLGRCRLPDHHVRRAGAAGHRASPRRRHLGGDGGGAVRARLHRAQAGVQTAHSRQALSRSGAGTSGSVQRDDRRADRAAPRRRVEVRGHEERPTQPHALRHPGSLRRRQPARRAPGNRPHPPDPGAFLRPAPPVLRRPRLRGRPETGEKTWAGTAMVARAVAVIRPPRRRQAHRDRQPVPARSAARAGRAARRGLITQACGPRRAPASRARRTARRPRSADEVPAAGPNS